MNSVEWSGDWSGLDWTTGLEYWTETACMAWTIANYKFLSYYFSDYLDYYDIFVHSIANFKYSRPIIIKVRGHPYCACAYLR